MAKPIRAKFNAWLKKGKVPGKPRVAGKRRVSKKRTVTKQAPLLLRIIVVRHSQRVDKVEAFGRSWYKRASLRGRYKQKDSNLVCALLQLG